VQRSGGPVHNRSLSLSLPIGAVVIVESERTERKSRNDAAGRPWNSCIDLPRDVSHHHTIPPSHHIILLHHTMPYRNEALFECPLPRNLAVAPGCCVVISIQVLPVIVPFGSVWFGSVWFGSVWFVLGSARLIPAGRCRPRSFFFGLTGVRPKDRTGPVRIGANRNLGNRHRVPSLF